MNSNDFANTELVLKLGLTSSPSMAENTTNLVKKPSLSPDHRFEPSLTLALSGDSSGGGGSSFSNVSVKREREVASEESNRGAVNIISSEDGEEDEDGGVNARKKLRLSRTQSQLLEQAFKLHTTLNPKQKQELARELKLRPRQVEVWFQNRRARTKLKQTEIDCEYLKKCYEALMHENRKLRQQVQELKAQPIYMQLPAATLTMCPSCEQIGESNSGGKGPFTMAPKPQFFNPFTTSSAAC